MKRELTTEERYHLARSTLYSYLRQKQMYYTQALASAVDIWAFPEKHRAVASIRIDKDIKISIRKDIIDIFMPQFEQASENFFEKTIEINPGFPFKVSARTPCFLILHELRHIPQCYTETSGAANRELDEDFMKMLEDEKTGKIKGDNAHRLQNICMDMALHADILSMKDINQGDAELSRYNLECEIRDTLTAIKGSQDVGIGCGITVDLKKKLAEYEEIREKILKGEPYSTSCHTKNFDKMFPKDPESPYSEDVKEDMSWTILTNIAFRRMKKKMEEVGSNGTDEHDFDDDDGDNSAEARKKRTEKAMRQAQALGNDMVKGSPGKGAADAELFMKEKYAPQYITALLMKIRNAVKVLSSKPKSELSWRMIRSRNSFFVPTERYSARTHKPAIILVLDTSGSMFNEETLSMSFSVANSLMKAGHLSAMYCCDTELRRVDPSDVRASRVGLIGGGGTDLGSEQVRQIREDLDLPANKLISVVYVTDMYVDLTEVLVDKTVDLICIKNEDNKLSIV